MSHYDEELLGHALFIAFRALDKATKIDDVDLISNVFDHAVDTIEMELGVNMHGWYEQRLKDAYIADMRAKAQAAEDRLATFLDNDEFLSGLDDRTKHNIINSIHQLT